MESDGFYAYIKTQKWFLGTSQEASVLFYSTRQAGIRKYLKEWYGLAFETILVPSSGKMVRVINLAQSNALHEISRRMVTENPNVLRDRVAENDALWSRISQECAGLDNLVKAGDSTAAIQKFNTIVELYALNGAQFLVTFYLGLELMELALPETQEIQKVHDIWRNSVALKEESMGESWYRFFKFIADLKKVKSDPMSIMSYLFLDEINDWLRGSDIEVDKIITQRQKQGFIFLDLQDWPQQVIDDVGVVQEMSKFVAKLDEPSIIQDEIHGQSAYKAAPIRGEVLIVTDKNELRAKSHFMAGKILAAIQTTPHYIPYIKDVKALITDEGGITCHAAIVSREFKIPCVIGTKIATKVLHDGDEVEVDAEKGIVRIIKNA
jgi:phosphohistidine swiveling domain-containing protein